MKARFAKTHVKHSPMAHGPLGKVATYTFLLSKALTILLFSL